MMPVVNALKRDPAIVHTTCVTGQHRQMLDSVLDLFGHSPDIDLNIMKSGQDLAYVTTAVLEGVTNAIEQFQPDWVIVQGDTTTAMVAALAAFYKRVKVAHVEAGLRTGNLQSPWPEEMNRRVIASLASVHFPPTVIAGDNLRREHVREADMLVTGNTVIDALVEIASRLDRDAVLHDSIAARFPFLNADRRMILVTGHRRENFDGGLEQVCRALVRIAERDDIEVVYPVHLNPNVQATAQAVLADSHNIHLIEPQDYLPFIFLMRRANIIVTDSGGIQEEAPGLGKPVLVTRDTTERPEAVDAGTARLIGTSTDALIDAITELLDDPSAYAAMAQAKNPFGDGHASERILNWFKEQGASS